MSTPSQTHDKNVERAARLDTPTLSDALDKLGILGQCYKIKPRSSDFRMAGRAWTLKYGPAAKPCGTVGDYIDDVAPGSVVVLDPKGQEFQRRQELVAQSKEIEARYAREGKAAPTPRQILTELETGLEKRRNSEAAKAAREQLDRVWSKQKWINGPISRKNLSQLEHLAKGDQKKERDLAQIKKLLDQAGE